MKKNFEISLSSIADICTVISCVYFALKELLLVIM